MGVPRTVALVAATLTMGHMAGVFGLYAHTLMPGLRRTDDRTFVRAFRSIDTAIVNPWFMAGGFLGALVFTGLAAALHLGRDARPALPWLLAALLLYVAVVAITVAVHLPLNNALKAATDGADDTAVRRRFDEARWVRWNLVRVALTTAAFGCLAWALTLS
jgi:uncharacterized membrane protein